MRKILSYLLLSSLLVLNIGLLSSCNKISKPQEQLTLINWRHEWNDKIFNEAKTTGKPIMLSLEANWCHWCHVMHEKNYLDDEIASLLNENFIPVAIDQDANPFLANLYKNYGWPATIFFSPDGYEISKNTGYIEPLEFKKLLEKISKNPNQTLSIKETKFAYSKDSSLNEAVKQKLINNWKNSTDYNLGGLKTSQKYLDRDTVEYALLLVANEAESNTAKQIAKVNLDNAIKLQDPVWGGFFQYSSGGNWDHLHYEKLTEIQAEYIRSYTYAYLILGDKKYLTAAKKATNYMLGFMKDFDGSFYSSQDADLKAGERAEEYYKLSDIERRVQGIPRIDKNRFPNKNGLMIDSLATLYKATGNSKYLNAALNASKSMINNFQKTENKNSLYFVHSSNDKNLYLSDNLNMSRAFLSLYEVTANKAWLYKSIAIAEFIKSNFRNTDAGYVSSKLDIKQNTTITTSPKPIINENIKLARLFNNLYHYSANPIFMQEADHIMKYLATEEIAFDTFTEPGILVADVELNTDPIHYCLVAPKNNNKAKQLYQALLKCPNIYSRLEWYDFKEGKLLNHDVDYPTSLEEPAVFGCANKVCSMPIYELEDLQEKLKL